MGFWTETTTNSPFPYPTIIPHFKAPIFTLSIVNHPTCTMNANLQVVDLRAEVEELKTQRRELRQLSAYQQAEAARIQMELGGAQHRNQLLSAEWRNMGEREAKMKEELKVMAAQIEKLNEELKQVNEHRECVLKDKDAEVSTLQASFAQERRRHEGDRDRWEEELKGAKDEAKVLREENQILKGSLSREGSDCEGRPLDVMKVLKRAGYMGGDTTRASKKAKP